MDSLVDKVLYDKQGNNISSTKHKIKELLNKC